MRCEDIKKGMLNYDVIKKLQMTAFPPEESFTMEEILRLLESVHIEYNNAENKVMPKN